MSKSAYRKELERLALEKARRKMCVGCIWRMRATGKPHCLFPRCVRKVQAVQK